MFRMLFVCMLLIGAGCAEAQDRIDADRMLHDTAVLSADSMEGRGTGTPGGARARAYLTKAFEEAGLQAFEGGYAQPFALRRQNKAEGVNVVGYLPGTRYPDRYLVVSAHYDHLGVRNGEIYNGADDNASGTAALLALARYLQAHPLGHSVIFAAFDAEEAGLQGGHAFAAHPPVPREALLLNVNLDMVSRSEAGELYVAGLRHYPALAPTLEAVAARSRVTLRFGHDQPGSGSDDWTNASDHAAFHQAGIPFVYFGVEDHAGYHHPDDDFEHITPVFFAGAVETILDAVIALDAAQARAPAGGP